MFDFWFKWNNYVCFELKYIIYHGDVQYLMTLPDHLLLDCERIMLGYLRKYLNS